MSTPLFQEALIEAKKLREAATAEAKNAVMEAISPVIKQMIDREINGIILEQEEPSPDAPPPSPPAPSPDAGAAAPIEPAGGPEADLSAPMPPAAVAAAAPPIASPNAQVLGTITTGPDGGQRITIPIDQLFQPEANPAVAGTNAVPEPEQVPMAPEAGQPPAPPEAAPEEMPKSLAEIYSAVSKLIAEQAAPAPTVAAPPPAPMPQEQSPVEPMMQTPPVPGVTLPVPPVVPVPPAPTQTASAPAMEAVPPAGVATEPPAPIAPVANAAAPVAPIQEYKNYKQKFEKLEEAVTGLRKNSKTNKHFIKESCEKEIYSLYTTLINLKENNAISPRLFSFNEERLELLHENLNLIYSYTKIPLLKGNNMQTKRKDSLKEFAKSLFEGAEGFEKSVGHVDPEGDAEGGDAEHAHKLSGNPNHVKAEAEKAKFPTKQKNEWPGKPSAESLLEQLEEEIAEFMSEVEDKDEDKDEDEDEVVLELDEREVVAEAARSRKRLRALREQAEADAEDDSLTLDIDLDGAGAEDVSVNVNVNGEPVTGDEDMEDMDAGDEEETGEEEGEEEEGEEEEEAALQEVRKLVRRELRLLESKEESKEEEDNENKDLRGQLQETQLLTARSLYLNKIFVRDDLSGTQKRKIVEYLDSARTISEAKEVYNRIVKVLNTAKKSGMMNESVDGRRNLNEGRTEPGFDTSRWQILAGVKKS